ncbi:MAG: DMT family transporter [Candidatus Dependentiae bacterium]|nr:DMT family transporter [Candidatus Dependentiae bacterium]
MTILLIILMYALFATTFPVGQYALRLTTPLLLNTIRMLLAGTILLTASLISERQQRLSKGDWWQFVFLSFFYIYLAFVPELWAQQYLTPLTVNVMYSATPLIALIFEKILFNRPLTASKIAALGFGFIGMIPLFCIQATEGVLLVSPIRFLPELVLLIGIISTCYAWFLVKDLNTLGYGLLFINGLSMLVGGTMSLLHFVVVAGFDTTLLFNAFNIQCLACIIGLILASNIIGYPLYGFLLRFYSVSFLSFAGFLTPLFGALYAWLLGIEPLTWHHFLAGICITFGLAILYRENKKP